LGRFEGRRLGLRIKGGLTNKVITWGWPPKGKGFKGKALVTGDFLN